MFVYTVSPSFGLAYSNTDCAYMLVGYKVEWVYQFSALAQEHHFRPIVEF